MNLRKWFSLALAAILALCLLISGCTSPTATTPAAAPTVTTPLAPTTVATTATVTRTVAPTPVATTPTMAATPTWDWKCALFIAPNTSFHRIVEEFSKRIYKNTGGRLKITVYPGAVLAPHGETFNAVGAGLCEMGIAGQGYTAALTTLPLISMIPGLVPQDSITNSAKTVLYLTFHPQAQAEVAKMNLIYGYTHGIGQCGLILRNKKVEKLEDFKGINMRASGLDVEIAKAWGANPVAIPGGETVEAFQKGILDLQVVEIAEGWKSGQYQFTKYVSENAKYGGCFAGVINLGKWNSLPQDIKDIWWQTTSEIPEISTTINRMEDNTAIAGMKAAGVQFYRIQDAEMERIFKAATPVFDIWINDCASRGKGDMAKQYLRDVTGYVQNLTGKPWTIYTVPK